MRFTALDTGTAIALALGTDGKLYAWGRDTFGEVGDAGSAATYWSTPVEVALPAGVSAVSFTTGEKHSLVVGSDGKTYGWGDGRQGELGDGLYVGIMHQPIETAPGIVVTAVTFDGIPGTNLVRDGQNWKVTTPPHAAGPVDVTLEWRQFGHAQTPLTLTGEFLYIAPITVAEAPTDVAGIAGDAQVALTWAAPSSDDGSAITDYLVEYSDDDGATWATFARAASDQPTATVDGLTNGVAYLFRVSAVNSIGPSVASAVSAAVTPVATIVEQPKPPVLVATGGVDHSLALMLGGGALLAGAVLTLWRRRTLAN